MTPSGFRKLSTGRLLLAAAIVAIVSGASVGLSVGYVIHYDAPTTRVFYLFNGSLPFDEHTFHLSHDTFVPDRITVNKGDHVVIHYLNVEDVSERHSFDMDSPYTFDAVVYHNVTEGGGLVGTFSHVTDIVLGQGQNATITFTASWAGTFRYYCYFHQPTMTGYLVVIG